MIVSEHNDELKNAITELKKAHPKPTIGFVPTMGALHEGHLSLVKKASEETDIVVVSIFVNPTQFNDKNDLERYPRTIEEDLKKLSLTKCNIVFTPSVEEVYPHGKQANKIDLNGLDKSMEGLHRKGHFDGVAMVVERLFELVKPDKAFFGLKDFQQVAVINQMVKVKELPIEIVPVDIVRSSQGLALSSRNALLSEEERENALIIHKTLKHGKALAQKGISPSEVVNEMKTFFSKGKLRLEYIEIVDSVSLKSVNEFSDNVYCCIAAYCGKIRLIDNMKLS